MSSSPIVEQIMSHTPAVVMPDEPIRIAIDRMRECCCRRLPVLENDRLVGIITDRDLRRATNSPFVLRERGYDEFLLDHITIRVCMSPNPVTVTPQTPVADAARIMRERKFGGLPVIQDDRLVGIVTETDLLDFIILRLETELDPSAE